MVFLAQETCLELLLGCESPSNCLFVCTGCNDYNLQGRVLQYGGFEKQVGKNLFIFSTPTFPTTAKRLGLVRCFIYVRYLSFLKCDELEFYPVEYLLWVLSLCAWLCLLYIYTFIIFHIWWIRVLSGWVYAVSAVAVHSTLPFIHLHFYHFWNLVN